MKKTTVTILHLINTRDNDIDGTRELVEMLVDGRAFCLAGTIEVDDVFNQRGKSNEEMYESILDEAYRLSQNDVHHNPVLDRAGNVVIESFQSMASSEFGGDQYLADRYVKDRGWKIGPAVWNGEFAQRSSMIGDLIVVDDHVFRVHNGFGFKFIKMISKEEMDLGVNDYKPVPAPVINTEFDELVFLGE